MKATYLLIIFLAVFLLFDSCVKRDHISELSTSDKLDSLLELTGDFSGVVLVADHGKIIFHKAYGLRNREQQVPLDTTDIFELASVSKQFTAMIIMMLQEEGKLQFDDSLSRYLPALPYHGITIRHLLTHTSGIPDYQDVMDKHWDKSKVAGNADNIAYLTRYHPIPLFAPGERFEYSNTGYMLLASIAEQASGLDYIDMCRKRIFQRIGLVNTDIRTKEEKSHIDNFARGYIFVDSLARYVAADSFPQFNYSIWLGNRKGPGRISSTSGDLLKWDQALYRNELVKEETFSQALLPMKLNNDSLSNYGFAWNISKEPDLGRVFFHTGDNPGYKTEIVRYIDQQKTIIFLNNNAHPKKREIMGNIRKIVEAKTK